MLKQINCNICNDINYEKCIKCKKIYNKVFDLIFKMFYYKEFKNQFYTKEIKKEISIYLQCFDIKEFDLIMSEHIKEKFLSEDNIKEGIGIIKLKEFLDWFSKNIFYL